MRRHRCVSRPPWWGMAHRGPERSDRVCLRASRVATRAHPNARWRRSSPRTAAGRTLGNSACAAVRLPPNCTRLRRCTISSAFTALGPRVYISAAYSRRRRRCQKLLRDETSRVDRGKHVLARAARAAMFLAAARRASRRRLSSFSGRSNESNHYVTVLMLNYK